MKSRLELPEYPAAWADYRRRWYLAWTIPLALLAFYLFSAFITDGHPWTWVLIVGVVIYILLYVRFIRWKCPRCGLPYTKPQSHGMPRVSKCAYCQLPRDQVS